HPARFRESLVSRSGPSNLWSAGRTSRRVWWNTRPTDLPRDSGGFVLAQTPSCPVRRNRHLVVREFLEHRALYGGFTRTHLAAGWRRRTRLERYLFPLGRLILRSRYRCYHPSARLGRNDCCRLPRRLPRIRRFSTASV